MMFQELTSIFNTKLGILKCFIITTIVLAHKVQDCNADEHFEPGVPNKLMRVSVSENAHQHIKYSLSGSDLDSLNVTADFSVDASASLEYPILITVQQRYQLQAVELPFSFSDSSMIYQSASATLCFYNDVDKKGQNVVFITITTHNPNPAYVNVTLHVGGSIILPLQKDYIVDISPLHPTYVRYDFKQTSDLKTVLLSATSDDSYCMTLSIQTPYCPIYEDQSNVKYQGQWQTISTKGATTIQNTGDYEKGFNIVLVVNKNDELCGNSSEPDEVDFRNKRVTLHLKIANDHSVFNVAWILPIILMGLCVTIVIVLMIFSTRYIRTEMISAADKYIASLYYSRLRTLNSNDLTSQNDNAMSSVSNQPVQVLVREPLILETTPEEEHKDTVYFEFTIALANKLHDSACTGTELFKAKNRKRLKRYGGFGLAIMLFYTVPVYLLIWQHLHVYHSGNYDVCYYNFKCATPYGKIVDFNHMLSNIPYILFGVLFAVIVRIKISMHRSIDEEITKMISDELDGPASNPPCPNGLATLVPAPKPKVCSNKALQFIENHGLPLHLEFYYTLALILIMEGLMSAAYHICPNRSTFQFDTCFMYVIATMGSLKIYQMRHPDFFGPARIFLLASTFQFLVVVSIILEHSYGQAVTFWMKVITAIIYFFGVTLFCLHSFTFDRLKPEQNTSNGKYYHWCLLVVRQIGAIIRKASWTRLLLQPSLLIVTFALALFKSFHANDVFANHVLFILLGAFISHICIYIIMKMVYGEFQNRYFLAQTLFLILCFLVLGGFSLKYFFAGLTRWEITAAESQQGNEECSYSSFDHHDIWHFLSAMAVFLLYILLLLMDDNISAVHRAKIPVF